VNPSRIRIAILSMGVVPCTAFSLYAAAQGYPDKALRVVVPFPAGKICG